MSPTKWKRKRMQLRFQTSSGPLVLEIYKDEKRGAVVETVDLSNCEATAVAASVLQLKLASVNETLLLNFDKVVKPCCSSHTHTHTHTHTQHTAQGETERERERETYSLRFTILAGFSV